MSSLRVNALRGEMVASASFAAVIEHLFPRVPLQADTLYLGDNGRAFCGRLACAGMTAHFTGRDLSGQRVETVTALATHEYGLACEGCGMVPELLARTIVNCRACQLRHIDRCDAAADLLTCPGCLEQHAQHDREVR